MTRPHLLRPAYLRIVKKYLADIQRGCDGSGVDYVRLMTNRPLGRGAGRVPRASAADGAAMSAESSSPSPLAGEGSERSERVRGETVRRRHRTAELTPHPAAKRRHPLPQGERARTRTPPPCGWGLRGAATSPSSRPSIIARGFAGLVLRPPRAAGRLRPVPGRMASVRARGRSRRQAGRSAHARHGPRDRRPVGVHRRR